MPPLLLGLLLFLVRPGPGLPGGSLGTSGRRASSRRSRRGAAFLRGRRLSPFPRLLFSLDLVLSYLLALVPGQAGIASLDSPSPAVQAPLVSFHALLATFGPFPADFAPQRPFATATTRGSDRAQAGPMGWLRRLASVVLPAQVLRLNTAPL